MKRRKSFEDWVKECQAKYGKIYDYTEAEKSYYLEESLKITCKEHNYEFSATPKFHLRSRGCAECTTKAKSVPRKPFKYYMDKIIKVHGDTYDYSRVKYAGANTPIKIVCKLHGVYEQSPATHSRGHGCPKCAPNYTVPKKDYLKECAKVHNNKYGYKKVVFTVVQDKIKIKCPEHGYFRLRAYAHLQGQGCYACGRLDASDKVRQTEAQFAARLAKISSIKYKAVEDFSTTTNPKIKIYCDTHGVQDTRSKEALHRSHPCPKCRKGIDSKPQRLLLEKVQELTKSKVLYNHRLKSGKHIDIYLAKYKLGIEVNGLYWHSADKLPKDYHLNKTREARKEGIELLHFWDYEILNKDSLVVSIIKSKMGKCKTIYARKTSAKEISSSVANQFLESNHLQGKCTAKIHYGLFLKEKLVAVMNFGAPRFSNTHDWELIRYAGKKNYVVVGGASKLLAAFDKDNPEAVILSYANRRISTGNLYRALGFKLVDKSKPNYFYFKGKQVIPRYRAQKAKLAKLLEYFDPESTEEVNMYNNGYTKVYDCGNLVFVREPAK